MSTDPSPQVDLHKVCTLLDKLTLDALTLMEQEIQAKIDMEATISEGESHLSKARYILGHSKVSKLQLPTEDSPEFEALAVVHSTTVEEKSGGGAIVHDLEIRKPEKILSEVTNDATDGGTAQDPMRWFGVLVPRNLQMAQMKFKQALISVVHATNVQNQLRTTCDAIGKLTAYKIELTAKS